MKLNRDVLINLIVKHQRAFLVLLDYIDEHGEALEIPEHIYLHVYRTMICNDEDEQDELHLSIPSLLDNGVLIHHDRAAGILTIAQIVIDLLRFLDVKRARELTNSDFNQMRSGLVNATQQVIEQQVDTELFDDAMRTFNTLMGEIHSKIKDNVATLGTQVNYLARDYKQFDAGSTDISVFDLYDRVSSLYNRFVLPCYEFISPSMDMVQTLTFSQAIQSLIDYFGEKDINRPEVAGRIQLRKTAITSYYKDIDALAKKLEKYSSHLEKERRDFLAIENAYSVLLDSMIPLRHGKKRRRTFKPDSDVFSLNNGLDGLSSHKNRLSSKFNWEPGTTSMRFGAYKVALEDVISTSPAPALQPVPPDDEPDHQRQVDIMHALIKSPLESDVENLHQHLFGVLQDNISDAELRDLLYALEVVLPQYENTIRRSPDLRKNRIDDGRYFLDYVQVEHRKGEQHV